MGNKKKIGKQRRDKFYQLAKESGFRARSAFKLIQLNRKFEFLQSSRVVIDLCAAPGGWLQVAAENCPVSSLIVGVDLVPIKPIRNVTTLIDDITTDKCRQDLRKELQTWKADCVLNDGAPNVGKNWVHDAFQQVQLTLSALKLATEFLRKGGWFVTKVFRSKDYNSLLWVLQQLFKNVHATKPQASRNESAEIFVVCQHFLAPDKIDPKFLDPKHVFKEVDDEVKTAINLIHPEKQRRHREGYPEGDYTLFHTLPVSKFFESDNYLQLLAEASEIVFDDDKILNDPTTTDELKECLKDIKVLGKKEIRNIINWRKKLVKDKKETKTKTDELQAESESEDEDDVLKKQLEDLEGEERRALKRKIKKTRKEKSKLQHKMDLKMVLPDDNIDFSDDRSLFALKKISGESGLKAVEDTTLSDHSEESSEESDEEVSIPKKKQRVYDRNSKDHLDANGYPVMDEDEDLSDGEDSDASSELFEDEDFEDSNPLLVGEDGKATKTEMWFNKASFEGLDEDDDVEDVEIGKMAEEYKKKGGVVLGFGDVSETKVKVEHAVNEVPTAEENEIKSDNSSESESSCDSDSDYDTSEFYKQQKKTLAKNNKKKGEDDFEVMPSETKNVRLSAKELAMGTAIISSKKKRRELIESAYNRHMFDDDENLPAWFLKDEQKHRHVQQPVTKADIEEYKMKMKAVDANPIKKIAEAKARKKRKHAKKLERARKKAEVINDTAEVTDREKWQQIKQVYKRAGLLSAKKKEVTYVIAKKGLVGKRAKRPNGVQGPYKVVDARMKKDNMTKKGSKGGKKGRRK